MTDLPEGAVVVTTTDMYKQLLEATRVLGEVKGAVESMSAVRLDHEARIRVLERRCAVAIPAVGTAGVGGIVAALWQALAGG